MCRVKTLIRLRGFSDQTVRMRRLICVFAGRICNFVGSAVPGIIC